MRKLESDRLVWCSGSWSVCLRLLRLYHWDAVAGGGNSLSSTWFGPLKSLKKLLICINTRLQTSCFCQNICASNICRETNWVKLRSHKLKLSICTCVTALCVFSTTSQVRRCLRPHHQQAGTAWLLVDLVLNS